MPETSQSKSIKAIELARAVFENIHGNLGLLKFSIEELKPASGTNEETADKWEITCSFYETLGSKNPSRYKADVDLSNNVVYIKKINGSESTPKGFQVVSTPLPSVEESKS